MEIATATTRVRAVSPRCQLIRGKLGVRVGRAVKGHEAKPPQRWKRVERSTLSQRPLEAWILRALSCLMSMPHNPRDTTSQAMGYCQNPKGNSFPRVH